MFLLKGGTATELARSPQFVAGLAWHRGTLYISGGSVTPRGAKWQLLAWSGCNGKAFTRHRVIYTAPKNFDGFNGLAVGPDGRLYGQDKGAKKPPDFILRVHAGDNYGFPHCNRTQAGKCRGYTKPFRRLSPHTDAMGLAIIDRRLYLTSFMGADGKGPGGAVYSMPLTGGPLKPVLTGFVAPVVGLGAHAGRLYVGALTGQVFSVRP